MGKDAQAQSLKRKTKVIQIDNDSDSDDEDSSMCSDGDSITILSIAQMWQSRHKWTPTVPFSKVGKATEEVCNKLQSKGIHGAMPSCTQNYPPIKVDG